ncbi:uncharacterized protein LOC106166988 [Lingula anatina]|uniref:Uncharacterized protein LOC106166988 n=1 Tax=Lingula anatina TaxID=7574 RepID=A0A1S3IT41_LINAN|nr:uncharacterized protein LOC106166988 [Lingula anatina]|eukprot:XP_013401101.1 uncharacterized protein LOC106166988 [Lingula anatina]
MYKYEPSKHNFSPFLIHWRRRDRREPIKDATVAARSPVLLNDTMHLFLAIVLSASLAVAEGGYVSPRFIVRHRSSGRCYAYADWWSWGHHYEKFRADNCPNAAELEWHQKEGHWGYLKVVGTAGHCLNPFGGWAHPGDNTAIFPHPNCYNSALFAINQEKGFIKHSGGKYVHPYPYNGEMPSWHSDTMIHGGTFSNMQFDFLNRNLQKVQVIPNPSVAGDWVKISCWGHVGPGSLSYTFKAGYSKTESSTLTNSWEMTIEVAKKVITASVTYSGSYSTSYESQWTQEREITRTVTVTVAGTICLWQWQYVFEQFNDKYVFKPMIMQETRSDVKPTNIPRNTK